MTKPRYTRSGYRTRLDCPACGEPVKSMLPHRKTDEHPYPWWDGGDRGTCQCGASLVVEADGERAWLVEAKP